MTRFPTVHALAALIALAAAPPPAGAQEGPRTISVSGTGEVVAVPDMAMVTAGVRARAASADAALAANSEQMRRVFQALEALGVARRDIRTVSLSLHAIYRQVRIDDRIEQREDGFEASNLVRIRLRDMAGVGPALDALVEAGVNQLHGVAFDVSNKDALMDEARGAAVRDALRKARLYADAADVAVGRVLSISEAGGEPPIYPRAEMAMARDAGVPVAEGEQTIAARVSVVYEIAQ